MVTVILAKVVNISSSDFAYFQLADYAIYSLSAPGLMFV